MIDDVMDAGFSVTNLRRLACCVGPQADLWLAFVDQDCALRIGSGPTLYGLAAAQPALRRFLRGAVEMGRAGCDLAGDGDFWIAETDISFVGRAGLAPEPCVVCVRTRGRLIKDLRFYIDLAPLQALVL